MKLIMVGGIHGAGKTSLCRALAPVLGAEWVSAGAVLRSAKGGPVPGQDKVVENVKENQEAIVQVLASTLAGIETPVLLDGHFVLWKGPNQVAEVPVDYFRALDPVALVIMDTPIGVIKHRLNIRDSEAYSRDELNHLRTAEISHGQSVSQALDIPLAILAGPNSIDTAREFLAPLL